jgi:hypothetical protein
VTRPAALIPALACALAALALPGCSFSVSAGGPSGTERVTKQIEQAYEDRAGLALRDFTCAEIENTEGSAIRCKGSNSAGVALRIEGEVTNVEGSEIDYHWDVARAVAPGSTYAEAAVPVVERIAGEPVAGVRCGKQVVVEVGQILPCEMKTADGEIVPIRLRLTDTKGAFEVVTDDQSGRSEPGIATGGV